MEDADLQKVHKWIVSWARWTQSASYTAHLEPPVSGR